MKRGEGWWFDSKNFDLIEVVDHMIFLETLEAQVRNELDLDKKSRRYAASLGLEAGTGWGSVSGEQPGERRTRFISNALREGWIRIRQQERYLVLEVWRQTEEAVASMAMALKAMRLLPTREVEIHDVSQDRPSIVMAGDLYAALAGTISSEAEARLGFSVFTNPPKTYMCSRCLGLGYDPEGELCSECNGTGRRAKEPPDPFKMGGP